MTLIAWRLIQEELKIIHLDFVQYKVVHGYIYQFYQMDNTDN